jgi:hypothetical protein
MTKVRKAAVKAAFTERRNHVFLAFGTDRRKVGGDGGPQAGDGMVNV